MSEDIILVEDVYKTFGKQQILGGVDLNVETGELVVLMGPNGAGKSVLLSCIAGSERPSHGTTQVLGNVASGANADTSFLLQDALCLDRLTGRENIAFYRRLHPQFTGKWRKYVKKFEIKKDLDRKVGEYSGGMKRKLELTIALSIDVPIYLLDEPTAALDLSMIQEVHGILRDLQRDGKTVVVTSHLPMDADIADRVAFLHDGKIVTTGTPEALLSSLPPVLTTPDTNADALTERVIDGRLFDGDGRVRGFLIPEKTNIVADKDNTTEIENSISEATATYTDLFNYYTKLSPDTNDSLS